MRRLAFRKITTTLTAAASMLLAITASIPNAAEAATTPNIWAACTSSQPMPAYAALVKGMHGTCVHTTAQVFQFDTVTGSTHMLIYYQLG